MSNLIQVIVPIIFIILLWGLIITLKGLQLYLYDHHRSVWEQVTIKRFLLFKREDYPILMFNYRVFPVVFLKDNLNDKGLQKYKIRARVLFLVCTGFAFIFGSYL